ncbi:uncharacterized protein BJX67DRAFT_169727 [Aspergillus lucknowensis]|uniref:C2H2-type domain-containing protein n=1 Tax=Aspergillus lucknowensis TaxID=176173 RepID=A0ABR4LQK6_9EURO
MAKRSRSPEFPSFDGSAESRSRLSSPESSLSSLIPSKIHLPDASSDSTLEEVMRCSLPPHRETLSFSSYDDYEVHYQKAHVNRCAECARNFPTDRFLTLHIEENHDSLIAARRERGEKTYGCFVENCERKCSTPQKRRMHLMDKHMFPKTYNFYIVNDGIDRQTSMLRSMQTHRRRLSSAPISPQEGRLRNRQTSISVPSSFSNQNRSPEPNQTAASRSEDTGIAELERSMSALRFVPASVTNKGRVGNRP